MIQRIKLEHTPVVEESGEDGEECKGEGDNAKNNARKLKPELRDRRVLSHLS